MENVREHRNINFVTAERRRNYLVSEPNYHTTKFFTKNLLEIFIVYIKTEKICKNIAEDVETRFDTSHYELDRSLPKGKNKKVIRFMKEELGGKIVIKFIV